MPPGSTPAAAVLYDDAPRLAKTQPVLMQKLAETWHAIANGPAPMPSDSAPAKASRQTGGLLAKHGAELYLASFLFIAF